MKHLIHFLLLMAFLTPSFSSMAYNKNNPKHQKARGSSKKIISEAGLNIPQWGVAIDAVYDSRLDNLVPGYKILNVILSNRGAANIFLDPRKDKWYVIDNIGKKLRASNHLRLDNEKVWSSLPLGLRTKLEYPQTVRVSHSVKIDLFFSNDVSLGGFREIGWDSDHFKKEFNVITATEKNPDDSNEPLPNTPTYNQSREKYDNLDPLLQRNRENPKPPDVDFEIKKDPPLDRRPLEIQDIPSLRD